MEISNDDLELILDVLATIDEVKEIRKRIGDNIAEVTAHAERNEMCMDLIEETAKLCRKDLILHWRASKAASLIEQLKG